MAGSDRSRSPMPGRNRSEPRGLAQPVRQELPFFPHASGCLALTTNVTPSVSTSFCDAAVGSLHAEQINAPKSTRRTSGHMAQSTVPTGTSVITSTNSWISSSSSPSHSTNPTHITLSTNTISFTKHSIRPIISTSSIRHSTNDLTRRQSNTGCHPYLWI